MQTTERDHDPWHLPHMAAYLSQCHADACKQGRTACPTPQACAVADNDADPYANSDARWFWSTYAVVMTITIVGIIVSVYF